MTTITIYKNSDQMYKGFVCMGHAGYGKRGIFKSQPDILCASISALVINTINSLEVLIGEKDNMKLVTNEETGFIKCDFEKKLQEGSVLLLDAMILGLTKLSEDYGKKYLQVKFEEV